MNSKIKYLFLPFIVLSLVGCGKSDVGDSISRKDFRSAVDFRYKNLTYLAYEKTGGEEKNVAEVYFLEDGSMYQAKAEGHDSHYWKREGEDQFNKIEKKGDYWSVTEIYSKEDYDANDYFDDVGCYEMVLAYKSSYEKFEFDKKTGTYSASTISEYFGRVDSTLKFKGKNLVECKMVGTKNGSDFEFKIEVKDHDKTKIDFESLHTVNNIYVSGRSFNFVSIETSSYTKETVEAINSNNDGSVLKFLADGTFELEMQYDFVAIETHHVYHGTYEFEAIGKRVIVTVTGEGNLQPIEGTISLNPENYATGAILVMDVKQAGAKATFKI